MDKQILFYSPDYQFYYSPKNKTISSPQIRGRKHGDYAKNWFICFSIGVVFWITTFIIAPILAVVENAVYSVFSIMLIYILARIFLKAKIYFEFALKVIWYVFFVAFFFIGEFVITIGLAMGEVISDIGEAVPIMAVYVLTYMSIGIVLTCKKSVNIAKSEDYDDTIENKFFLNKILELNHFKYSCLIGFEIFLICFLTCWMIYMEMFFILPFVVPTLIVAFVQRNIYYLFLIRKIAKKYGISLKLKDMLTENDIEVEKSTTAEKKLNTDSEINVKSDTNTEDNTEIENKSNIENKATKQNDENTDISIKDDIEIENKTNLETTTPPDSTQNSDSLPDKQ